MLVAIAGAKESIRLESYIFGGDAVGNQFCEAFVERALAGVKVRVHIDAAGCILLVFAQAAKSPVRQCPVVALVPRKIDVRIARRAAVMFMPFYLCLA
jgi:phosphatidylserine/phosphatidylglycerophosphate/cardiolipin synthase-like enzyme